MPTKPELQERAKRLKVENERLQHVVNNLTEERESTWQLEDQLRREHKVKVIEAEKGYRALGVKNRELERKLQSQRRALEECQNDLADARSPIGRSHAGRVKQLEARIEYLHERLEDYHETLEQVRGVVADKGYGW